MAKIGLWTDRETNENPANTKRKLKAAGCNKVIQGNADVLLELVDSLEAGDCITIASLTDLNIKPGELIELFDKVNSAGVTLCCLDLDGLTLPAGDAGKLIVQWMTAMESLRSVTRSRAVKTGLARAPSRRKLTDKVAFLADSKRMSQVKLAKHWGISITTARKYLAEWEE